MALPVPTELAVTVASWDDLSRWERSELGRALRRLGWSYGEIGAVLPVPKGTLAGWCRDIRLTADQAAAIRRRTGSRKGVPRDTQRKRREEVERIRREARALAVELTRDRLWVAGVSLYWAEGTKSQRQLEIANSDARVLRIFVAWVRAFHRPNPEFVLGLNLHSGNDPDAARRHWAATLSLTDFEWHKPYIKPPGTGHRKNRQAFGVCRVRLRRSADDWIRTMAWIDLLAESLE